MATQLGSTDTCCVVLTRLQRALSDAVTGDLGCLVGDANDRDARWVEPQCLFDDRTGLVERGDIVVQRGAGQVDRVAFEGNLVLGLGWVASS